MEAENHLQSLMIVAGIGILCWLMLRSRAKARARYEPSVIVPSMKHNANVKVTSSAFSGAASTGAPTEVLKWQVEMYDLARQLKAELDCKIVAVRKLTVDYNLAVERLNAAISEAKSLGDAPSRPIELAQRLSAAGCTMQQISAALSVPLEQLEKWPQSESGLAVGSKAVGSSEAQVELRAATSCRAAP